MIHQVYQSIMYSLCLKTNHLCLKIKRVGLLLSSHYFSTSQPYLAGPFVNRQDPLHTPLYTQGISLPSWLQTDVVHYSRLLFKKHIISQPPLELSNIQHVTQLYIPQIAIIGQSNVGKSTLVNALIHGTISYHLPPQPNRLPLNKKKSTIAAVSPIPGKTRQLCMYNLGTHLSIVDLPGYGYSKTSHTTRENWEKLIRQYITIANNLSRVICLIEPFKRLSENDQNMLDMLIKQKKQFMIVLTKVDLLQQDELHQIMDTILSACQDLPEYSMWPFIHAVSGRDMLGVQELRCSLAATAMEYRLQHGQRLFQTNPLTQRHMLHEPFVAETARHSNNIDN